MTLIKAMKLTRQYESCPVCDNDRVGGGEGTLFIDDNKFVRTCKCGWRISVKEDGVEKA